MLKRLATKGRLRNFNDVIAGELIDHGYARAQQQDLIVTAKGRQASRNVA